jgi:excisionase family DNA binding protein
MQKYITMFNQASKKEAITSNNAENPASSEVPGGNTDTLAWLGFHPGRISLSVLEVAKALSVTRQHVLDLIDAGRLPAVNVGRQERRYWRIPVLGLRQFLDLNNSVTKA